MSITTPPAPAQLSGLAAIDAADWSGLNTADPVPSDAAPSPPDESAPASADAGRDTAEAATHAETATPPPTETGDLLTLSRAELDARIADATRRAREDQSRTARERTALEREIKRLSVEVHARDEALKKLGDDAAQRYLTRPDVLEEQFRLRNYADGLLAQDAQQETAREQDAATLAQAKESAAATDYKDAMIELVAVASPLGVDRAALDGILESVLASDKTAQRFLARYQRAQSVEDAREASQGLYEVLTKEARVALQARAMADLTEREPPKTKTARPQAHGTTGSVGSDPLRDVPIAQRGMRRLDAAFDQWAAENRPR